MRSSVIQKIQRHTLWLSLLGHLLFLFGATAVYVMVPKQELPSTSPESIPSYLSPTPAPAPDAPPAPTPVAKPEPTPQPEPKPAPIKPKQETKLGLEKPVPKKTQQAKAAPKAKPKRQPQPVTFSRDTVPVDITDPRDQEPLHLIGESKIVKPLVKILARALSRHLTYPRVAADFNLRGVVLVGFLLHPEGYITEARVVKSSGAGVLDDEARDAVGAMSPVGDVHEYVPEPEFLVIGIIFG